ncbi:MAG: hypothetical protein IJ282_01920 [Lachnospiraceae bacterium]|nr:hypothetical protein [Lachnospiraceae bacterium]
MDYRHRVVPFYMAYQTPWFVGEEDNVLKDLDYLQQMYPAQAKKYQKRIAEIVDRMDYEGSMIYDEYPDRWQLYRLAESILEIIRQEEYESGTEETSPEKWEWLADMIQILLFHEIYRRRRGGKRGFLKF